MYAIEFTTKVIDGMISIPKEYRNKLQEKVKVIVIKEDKEIKEQLSGRLRSLTKYRLSILIGEPCRRESIKQSVLKKDRSLISIFPDLSLNISQWY